MNIPDNLYYSKDHEWLKLEGAFAYIGISDFAQHELGDIVFIELPEVEDELESEESFGVVESVKAVSDLFMPVGGKILEVNDELEDQPELVNSDPYESWIIKVELTDENEVQELMSSEDYKHYIAEEE